MNELLPFALTGFTGFFAIMNPIVGVHVFLTLVEGTGDVEKKRISKKASLVAFLIVFIFILFGASLFNLFGITIPAFKITGGILVFYVGFEMLQSKKSSLIHLKDL